MSYNWGFINDGATFQSLVSDLIRHKDPTARVYERSGPDAGIDIKSGDGKTVYQAKYITNQDNFSKVINRARRELDKIKEYKKKDHKNYNHWEDVENWCLLTNAVWNPNDEQQWITQVEIPFKDISLKVELRHKTDLEEDLNRFSNVKNEYFEGENRVLLSVSEAIDRFKDNIILSKGFSESIEGRSEELAKFSDFINNQDKKMIYVHGPGGIGKTRFAIEVALQSNKVGYDVFWANVATMETSNNWFQAVVSNRKALLIIDEPREKRSIEVLLEQITSHRLINWKFAIITRTTKDYILELLNYNILGTIEKSIEIKALTKEESKTLFLSLIKKSDKLKNYINTDAVRRLCAAILKISDGLPIWIAVAVKLLEDEGNINDLPEDPFALAKKYLEEFLSSPPESLNKDKFSKCLKAIAILQPVNIEDDDQTYDYFQALLSDIEKSELEEVFKVLQKKKFASKRGRLLEIKPDVIRDYIIFKKIGDNISESKEWLNKILNIKNLRKMKSALTQLAKVEFHHRYQGKEQTFFDRIWSLLAKRVEKGDLNELFNILEISSAISFANPIQFLKLAQEMQKNKKERQPIKWTTDFLYHDRLILDLPRAIYDAGRYVSTEEEAKKIFKELINLAEKEEFLLKEKNHFINDGNRAKQLLKELIENSNRYNYESIIFEWIIQQLNEVNNLNLIQLTILEVLTIEFLKIERHSTEVEDRQFIVSRFFILPDSDTQKYINKIIKTVWLLVNSGSASIENRKLLWKLLDEYHRQLNNCSRAKNILEKYKEFWEVELENSFNFLKNYISKHTTDISEIRQLRSIWEWNLRFDKREKFKKYAKECEDLLLQNNDKYSYIKPLFDDNRYYPKNDLLEKYYKKLNSPEKIYSFVNDCFKYDDRRGYDICRRIAEKLGKHINLSIHVLDYVDKTVKNKIFDHQFKFLCEILAFQSSAFRANNNEEKLSKFLVNYWQKLHSVEQKEYFLIVIYSDLHPGVMGLMTQTDIKFISEVLSLENSLSENSLYAISRFAGNIMFLDLNQSKQIIENIFKKTEPEKAKIIFRHYMRSAYDRTIFSEDYPFTLHEDMFPWLISLLLNYVPSLRLSDSSFWHDLIDIKRKLNSKFSTQDFVDVLENRLSLLEKKSDPSWENIFLDSEFLKIVDPIEQKDAISEEIKSSMEKLLSFNNHEGSLYYALPRIAANLDPAGILIPSMITNRLQNKKFLCRQVEDIPLEYEWTRYAGYYHTNSEPWRIIAKVACSIAIQKTEQEKKSIFSSLLNQKIQTFKGIPGKVPPYFYNKVERAEIHLNKEDDDSVLKEFMEWRLKGTKEKLKLEIQRNDETEV
ncbi:MAG: hypothetical protein OXM55_00930 [Bdellovibrionales bacterium]|nr:hypothetical protein [Bdellovibrionales bacterium]